MKRTLSLLLALLLLLAVPACAEETYVRQLPQYTYILSKLLSWESCPEVCIAPYSTYQYFTSYDPVSPMFLCFPGPEDVLVHEFDTDFVKYMDDKNAIIYTYQVKMSDSFEEFLNKAEKDEYILLDGSDGLGAYIDPERREAYGMIATREFGKSSKLVIGISLDNLDRKMPLETREQALRDAILPEVQRVSGQMHYEAMESFWSSGRYTGVKFLSDDFNYLLKVAFPVFSMQDQDGNIKETGMIVTSFRFDTLNGVYDFGDGRYADVEIEMTDNPYPVYRMGENDVDAQEIELPSGHTWTIYLYGMTENGKSTLCYASAPLNVKNEYDREYSLEITINCNNVEYSSVESFLEDLALFDANYEIGNAADDPYVPTERTSQDQTDANVAVAEAAGNTGDANTWICPNCGYENGGKFCTECGTQKPASEEWTCTNCGSVNNGKFCPECGTPRP